MTDSEVFHWQIAVVVRGNLALLNFRKKIELHENKIKINDLKVTKPAGKYCGL